MTLRPFLRLSFLHEMPCLWRPSKVECFFLPACIKDASELIRYRLFNNCLIKKTTGKDHLATNGGMRIRQIAKAILATCYVSVS